MKVTLTDEAMGTEVVEGVQEIDVMANNNMVDLDGERYGDFGEMPISRVKVEPEN